MSNTQQMSYSNQSGFALFMVLIMMIIIAFLVISTMQSTTMDSRTSANDSDHQLALQNAQLGLEDAEDKIRSWGDNESLTHTFSCDCKQGLCAARGLKPENVGTSKFILENCNTNALWEVWKRPANDNAKDLVAKVLTDAADDPSISGGGNTAESGTHRRYVIEYMGKNKDDKFLFRITAKGWGKNSASSGMVQEVVEATIPFLNKQ